MTVARDFHLGVPDGDGGSEVYSGIVKPIGFRYSGARPSHGTPPRSLKRPLPLLDGKRASPAGTGSPLG